MHESVAALAAKIVNAILVIPLGGTDTSIFLEVDIVQIQLDAAVDALRSQLPSLGTTLHTGYGRSGQVEASLSLWVNLSPAEKQWLQTFIGMSVEQIQEQLKQLAIPLQAGVPDQNMIGELLAIIDRLESAGASLSTTDRIVIAAARVLVK